MDHYLLILWNSTLSGEVKVKQIAEIIDLSMKQTRRKLHQWEEEGWLTFQSGKGRGGNASRLHWIKDVEVAYEKLFLAKIETYSIEEISKLLLLNWSIENEAALND